MVRGLDEFAVPDDLSPEILVERIEHPFPVVAAVIFHPLASDDVSRGILRRLGEQALEALEVAGGHFVGGFDLRPESCEVKVLEEAFSFVVVVDDGLLLVAEMGGGDLRVLLLEELVEVREVQAGGVGG